MGTRSIIAIPEGKTGFRGRYCHWDGYPEGVGEALRLIITRDGTAAAIQTLIVDNYGWSNVNGREDNELSTGYEDGRFAVVQGYGVAYTTEQNQSSPDDWMTRESTNSWCEYAYVIHADHVDVYHASDRGWSKMPKRTIHFAPSLGGYIPALDTEDFLTLA